MGSWEGYVRDTVRYGALPLVARLLIDAEFLVALNGKISGWSGQASYMASHGMRFIGPLLGAALAIELLGSICLISGWQARRAAAVMFVYLGIVSVTLHDFWNKTGNAAGANQTEFFKNLGIMGGLLMVAVYGPGLWAISRRTHGGGRVELGAPFQVNVREG
jgi:putative oxidoreductase